MVDNSTINKRFSLSVCVCRTGTWMDNLSVTLKCKDWKLTEMAWFDKWMGIRVEGLYRLILSIVWLAPSVFAEIWPIGVRVTWVCWPVDGLLFGWNRRSDDQYRSMLSISYPCYRISPKCNRWGGMWWLIDGLHTRCKITTPVLINIIDFSMGFIIYTRTRVSPSVPVLPFVRPNSLRKLMRRSPISSAVSIDRQTSIGFIDVSAG